MEPSIGERLKAARLARKISLTQAAQQTRIRTQTLSAFENDDFGVIPSRAQLNGFMRIYAGFLGLDGNSLLSELHGQPVAPKTAPQPEPQPEPPPAAPENAPEPPSEEIGTNAAPQPDLESAQPPVVNLSQTIFMEIGAQLRTRRELLSLTLAEIERHTHVRKHYLERIEQGALGDLPSPVQARGMLTAYARFLDIDPDALLLRFAEGLQARRIENLPPNRIRAPHTPEQKSLRNLFGRFISIDLLAGIGLVVAMTAFAIWGANRLIALSQGSPVGAPEGPSISEVLLTPGENEANAPAVSPTVMIVIDPEDITAAPALPNVAATPIPTLPSRANVQIIISVVERTFLRVIVDGKSVYNGRAEAGSAFPFDADQRIEVLTGNGASVQIVYNQQTLGPMGAFGEVINMVYTANGAQTPTPTVAPTATITPSPTRTPRPSPTLPPTRTPRPSPSPTFEPGG